ncbi:PIN/TRAM domain-containing protein [Facklamia sp. DSM 111018]|uniref:PIN/TRAM domain-containing protein n=1 Tax=Facklamia lactis TaxID=2749967 RepID=A0ABS0LSQ8_9LACT|nr:PIN/TRAM domain-containing protein [Facklamia lactis]MBG9981326.1 PIN/TRAM domain-containing protein [Facklamia lactis]MBG9987198.1 PIN/TRAM domain-containing protein [Facklamia lactis]
MIKKITILIAVIIGLSFGFTVGPTLWRSLNVYNQLLANPLWNALIFGLIFTLFGFLLAPVIKHFIQRVVKIIEKQPTSNLIIGGIGLLLGVLVGYLIALPIASLNIIILSSILPLILSLSGGLIGYQVTMNRRDEILSFFSKSNQKVAKNNNETIVHSIKEDQHEQVVASSYKILDTSVIIDGRIADILKTGFLEGILIVPHFVLAELQHIADSSDSLKRTKGRRGLDILNGLQKEKAVNIQIFEGDYEDVPEVDAKLVRLAKELQGSLITNDYNLNKVSEFQNVPVLNINELANAVKPALIPGEDLRVQILKSGTERRQGVAYLDDGTMVVVEEGLDHMNEWLNVTVTSSLQTAAGRMIFAKIID